MPGLLLDSAGTALAHALSLMTVRQGVVLFTFSTLKTVCDHGGYAFPWWLDPLHLVFPNCAEYHDVHHQMQGLRYNYSQPYFVHFDVLFGTRMAADKFDKIKEANRRWKVEQRISSVRDGTRYDEQQHNATATATSTSIASPANATTKRKTPTATTTTAPRDVPATQIPALEKDPLVTTDIESYRAKAGVAV